MGCVCVTLPILTPDGISFVPDHGPGNLLPGFGFIAIVIAWRQFRDFAANPEGRIYDIIHPAAHRRCRTHITILD